MSNQQPNDVNTTNIENKQAKQLLKKNAGNTIIVICIVLLAYFGWSYFQKNNTLAVDTVAADKFIEVNTLNENINVSSTQSEQSAEDKKLLKDTQDEFNQKVEALVTEHNDNIYAWQSLLLKSHKQVSEDDVKAAITSLKQASEIELDDAGLVAITQLRHAQLLLSDEQAEEAKTLVSKEVPASFEASKQELLGDIYQRLDDIESATRAYNNAWELLTERQENRPILMMKMNTLGIDAKPIETKKIFGEVN